MNAVCLWEPKWKTREALIAKYKVQEGKNYVFFCTSSLPDLYSYDGTKVKEKAGTAFAGANECYTISLDWLTSEGDLPRELMDVRAFQELQMKRRK